VAVQVHSSFQQFRDLGIAFVRLILGHACPQLFFIGILWCSLPVAVTLAGRAARGSTYGGREVNRQRRLSETGVMARYRLVGTTHVFGRVQLIGLPEAQDA